MDNLLANGKRPHNIEKRIREDNRIAEFTNYVRGVHQVHVDVLRANGKDKKRGPKQYQGPGPRDLASLLLRREELRRKLENEMRQYKLELSKKGLCFETLD